MTSQKDPNHLGQVNVNIPLNIAVISLVFAGGLTWIHFWIHKNHKEYKDILPFAVNTFATSAGSLSAYYAYKSLRQAAKDKKQEKAYHLIERWNSPEMLPLEISAKKILKEIEESQKNENSPKNIKNYDLKIYMEEHIEEKYKVTNILNFLVEIAVCIEKGIADEDVLKSFFKLIVQDYCKKFHDFIYSQKEGDGHQERYESLVNLNKKWNGNGRTT